MRNDELNISLYLEDFVDSEFNVFGRQIKVFNENDSEREVRLFMHQVFQISRSGRADTGLFEPEDHYILDYKGRCSLLIYGQDENGQVFDQFAIGNYGIEGKEGTYMDAVDGELSNSPVEHGGIDTVIRFSKKINSRSDATFDYWVIAADSQYSCEKIHSVILNDSLSNRKKLTRKYWVDWLSTGSDTISRLSERDVIATKKSLMIIKAHIDKRGGIIASCDSSIYNYGRDYYSYVWPRDGAYAIWPLIRLGYTVEAKNFFNFCRDIMSPEGYLSHKFQPDKAIGSTWHPLLHGKHKELAIQEDETAIIIFMLGEYLRYSNDDDFVHNLYYTLIKPACDFMSNFIDQETHLPHASYDLWEEKFLTSTYTTATVFRALITASELAIKYEHPDDALIWKAASEKIASGLAAFFDTERGILRKGFLLQTDSSLQFDNTLDISSLYGAMILDLPVDYSQIESTVNSIEEILLDKSHAGGTPRYEHDNYFAANPPFMGNPWFVTTLWMAQYYIRNGNDTKAEYYIDWTIKHGYLSGALSEQINPSSGEIVSVSPLVWTHAELINTILDVDKVNQKD
jgi:GH15 family glucan-1,4-alpha-glucosidase